jgi:hypothetical protein
MILAQMRTGTEHGITHFVLGYFFKLFAIILIFETNCDGIGKGQKVVGM